MTCQIIILFLLLLFNLHLINGFLVDITSNVFGNNNKGIIAAFGDYNSDKLTDVFVLEEESRTLRVVLASNELPYLQQSSLNCTLRNSKITSVVPGDFNGDSRMDVLVTVDYESASYFQLFWGYQNTINCTEIYDPDFVIDGHPLVFDYNGDKLPDILGEVNGQRKVWISGVDGEFKMINMSTGTGAPFRKPHSHTSIDLNKDLISDLVLTTKTGFEVWYREKGILNFKESASYDNPPSAVVIGQSAFLDIDLDGTINHVLPVCYDIDCKNSSILTRNNITGKWVNIGGKFQIYNNTWGFIPYNNELKYIDDAISLRIGDYDLDGYPDFLAILRSTTDSSKQKGFLIQNVPCEGCEIKRSFHLSVVEDSLFNLNNVVLAAFYDIYDNGVLDILLVTRSNDNVYSMTAMQNNYDSNACFMKIIVLSGLCYTDCQFKKVPYGVNQPGPTVCFKTTTADGTPISSCAGQLTQSAYFSLQLPYIVFGLGHTPNFVDHLKVGVPEDAESHHLSHEWTSLIPNSQMFVIPNLKSDHNKWINKLFVTPSHQVLITFAALCGVMVLMLCIVLGLHIKERREDKREKLKEAHKFHFDAM